MDWTGLAAANWDYFSTDASDQGFYLDLLTRRAGRALDVGCGTGRLLIPCLKAGIDVEGVDSSDQILQICRERAAEDGLAPVLYRQRMEELDLPHEYTAIIVPGGSFQLVTDLNEAVETLRRFCAHMAPGAVLAISLDDPDGEMSDQLLGRWRPAKTATRQSDGATLVHDRMLHAIDRGEKTTTTLLRYKVDLDGRRISEEVHVMRMRIYDEDEIRAMLKNVGLSKVLMHEEPRAVTAAK